MEYYLSWLIVLDISIFVFERCLFYLYGKEPLTSLEFHFFWDQYREELTTEVISILRHENEHHRIEEFEKLLKKHRPNREIKKRTGDEE